jgi:solute carrier family 25 aspartate/glutamate transporter 12/13/solute carrier family 25 carnitine/acylcarnitine transporter 20/29
MVLAQIRKEGFFKVFWTTGFKGLYLGWTATLYRDVAFNMVFFTTREHIVSQYEARWEPASPWKRVVLGLPAGVLASAVACPFDVIKTRMQGVKIGQLLSNI